MQKQADSGTLYERGEKGGENGVEEFESVGKRPSDYTIVPDNGTRKRPFKTKRNTTSMALDFVFI